MELQDSYYVTYNGSNVYVSRNFDNMRSVIEILTQYENLPNVTIVKAPKHHVDSAFRLRIVPVISDLISELALD